VLDSLSSYLRAIEAVAERLADVSVGPLAFALGFHMLNLGLRAHAWRSIVVAAYPEVPVRSRTAFGAYCAGVGVNAVLPARAGDAVKLVLLHRRMEAASYPTLAATLVAETIVDMVIGTVFIVWAWQAGLLPGLPALPEIGAFELSWLADRPWALVIVLVVLVVVTIWVSGRVRAFWGRVRQGLAILTMPWRYVREVVSFQLLGWCCRLASASFFLQAFGVPGTLSSSVLVQVASSVSTVLPVTPGGLGPKQALLVVLLDGAASRANVVTFSIGTELASTLLNVGLGIACLTAMFGGFRIRAALADARRPQA
jgi:uncharacterized membrane protein YbhN (UPF0104 family)